MSKNDDAVNVSGSIVNGGNAVETEEGINETVDAAVKQAQRDASIKQADPKEQFKQNIFYVGIGQAGTNVSYELYKSTTCAKDIYILNTAKSDLLSAEAMGIPKTSQGKIDSIVLRDGVIKGPEDEVTISDVIINTLDGTGKDRDIARNAFSSDYNMIDGNRVLAADSVYIARILDRLKNESSSCDRIVICHSTGGGSGSGGAHSFANKVYNILKAMYRDDPTLKHLNFPTIIILTILENVSELDKISLKQIENSQQCLYNLDKLMNAIPIILVDNSAANKLDNEGNNYSVFNKLIATAVLREIAVNTYGSNLNIDMADRNKVIKERGVKLLSFVNIVNGQMEFGDYSLSSFIDQPGKFSNVVIESADESITIDSINKDVIKADTYQVYHTPKMMDNTNINWNIISQNSFMLANMYDIGPIFEVYNSLAQKKKNLTVGNTIVKQSSGLNQVKVTKELEVEIDDSELV